MGSRNIGRSRTKIWLALPVLALMLAAIAMSGLQHGTAYAAVDAEGGTDMSLETADGGADSVPNGRPIVAEVRGRMKVVWSATLTVGEASQAIGLHPRQKCNIGDLDDTEFSDTGRGICD